MAIAARCGNNDNSAVPSNVAKGALVAEASGATSRPRACKHGKFSAWCHRSTLWGFESWVGEAELLLQVLRPYFCRRESQADRVTTSNQ
jgi:hypothetical protein